MQQVSAMLANAYGIVFIGYGCIAAVLSVLLAAYVEVRVLSRLWRVPRETLRFPIINANVASAVLGVLPVGCFGVSVGPGMDADPWHVAHWYWLMHVAHAALLFLFSLGVEGGCLSLWRRQFTFVPARGEKWRGLAAANGVSYAILLAFVLLIPRARSDFALLPDTSWLTTDAPRLWYFDRDVGRICSIELNGRDRRVEFSAPPFTNEGIWTYEHRFALIPTIHVALVERNLGCWTAWRDRLRYQCPVVGAPSHHFVNDTEEFLLDRGCMDALSGVLKDVELADIRRGEVAAYQSIVGRRPWSEESSSSDYHVSTHLYWGDGSGSGLTLTDKTTGREYRFAIPIATAYLACRDAVVLAKYQLVVFRCAGWIMVLDPQSRRVGRLAKGDSILMPTDEFRASPIP